MNGSEDSELRKGYLAGFGAYLLWGAFPLYLPLLKPAGPIEILAHRVIWSLALLLLLIWQAKAWRSLGTAVRGPSLRILLLAAVFISINWGVYIWAVNSNHIVEASLGYFINPLLTIVAGVALLHERLRRPQWVAVGVASAAILVLTVDYGRPPWISLILAATFASYGFCKKSVKVGAVESLTVETGVLFIPALVTLLVLEFDGRAQFGHHGTGNVLLLMSAGLVTAVPLVLFGAAARRLPLSAIGLMQYLTPVLQFGVGAGLRHEPMPPARWAGFGLVWIALVILTADALRHQRAMRSAVAQTA